MRKSSYNVADTYSLRKQPARYHSKQDPDYLHLVVLQGPVIECQLLY